MLRIVGSTLSLVGSGRGSIGLATNGSQRVGGCNPLSSVNLHSYSNLQSQNWTESYSNQQSQTKTQTKVAKKFKIK